MSHIVLDARELRTSSGRYVERLLHYLQQIDEKNNYTVLLKPKDMDGWKPTNPNFVKLSCPYKEFSFDEQLAFAKQVRELHADLVHFPFPQQPMAYRGKTVTTIHDLTTLRFINPDKNLIKFKLKQRVYSHVMKRAARKSVQLLTGSNYVKDDVVKFSGVNPSKITVTYEAADPIEAKPEALPALQGKQYIMYVGRPTPHKNLERLIMAFSQLKSEHPDLLLVLAGKKDGNYSRVETEVQQKGIEGVVFTDFVSDAELRWLYENCVTYVFPSLSEGFGLPGLEAMVHGAPVVSSNATCLPEIYGEAAHYFDPTDVKAMSAAINDVLTNKELRQKLVVAGKTQAQKYSWKRTAEQTLAVYQKALGTTKA